jgi:hypothetical protein
MSELGKRIGRVIRREAPGGIGFGFVKRETPRAMVLAGAARTADDARAALDGGVDVVILEGDDIAALAATAGTLEKARVGLRVHSLDEDGAASLAAVGDFIIAPLGTTAAAAVDTERAGHLVAVDLTITDTTLRSLAPLGLDALFVDAATSTTTLADQLELVRLATLSGQPLAVVVEPSTSVTALRVLRDSGVAIAIAPAGTSAEGLKTLSDNLRAVPAPKRGKQGGELAIVPAAASHAHDEDDEVEDP